MASLTSANPSTHAPGNFESQPSKLEMNRIVGGVKAEPQAFQWQVQLPFSQCGGTIICPKFVLTAFHCVDHGWQKLLAMYFPIIVGTNIKTSPFGSDLLEKGATRHKISEIISHPKAAIVGNITEFDCALLKLAQPIRFWNGSLPIYLPQPYDTQKLKPGSKFVVSGWGTTQNPRESPKKLRAVSLFYLPEPFCPIRRPDQQNHSPDQLCAGVLGGGKDACSGDSGGQSELENLI